ncbi:MAG: ribulose-phosphate 3-epimerase [Bacilli bacterium]|nr:ribulose-phosphate 3-epimerase [Bacilli bacterium]
MIVSASFLKIQDNEDKILELDKCADYMHYDVMDGIFTENKTPSLTGFRVSSPKDIHLMVTDVKRYVDIYSELNPLFMTFHLEVGNTIELINYIKDKGIKVGISINPETPISKIVPYLEYIDLVLVMSVHPGKGGQAFIDITDKIDYLYKYRMEYNLDYLIEVDGGINEDTIDKVSQVDIAVAGSYITDSENYEKQIKRLRGAL